MLINQLSNKAFAWLMSAFICSAISIALIVKTWNELETVARFIGWGLAAAAFVGVLYALYRIWDDVSTRHIKRRQLRSIRDHEEWKDTQTLLHQQELERERLRLEQMKAHNEHTRLMLASQWQHVPEGHTAIYMDPLQGMMQFQSPRQLSPVSNPGKPEQGSIIQAIYPEPVDFAQVLHTFKPSAQAIYMLNTVDQPITVRMEDVCHVGLGGPTGGGKTNTTRLLMAQLLYAGARMYFASPNFNQVKLNGHQIEDWRPIVTHLAAPPARDDQDIENLLALFFKEFEKRKREGDYSLHRGPDMFLVLGELPAIVARLKDAPETIVLLLREARQFGIHIITEFQDALVSTIGLSSGARENFKTGFYFGGDSKTAQILLDLPKGVKVDEVGIGHKGAVYLKSASNKAVSGRVPFFSNSALYTLLGTPPDPMPDTPVYDKSQIPQYYCQVTHDGRYKDAPSQAHSTIIESTIETRLDAPQPPLARGMYGSAQTRYTGPLETLVEPVDATSDERFDLLSEVQVQQFKLLYKTRQNIDYCLGQLRVGLAKYRPHARAIINEMREQGEL